MTCRRRRSGREATEEQLHRAVVDLLTGLCGRGLLASAMCRTAVRGKDEAGVLKARVLGRRAGSADLDPSSGFGIELKSGAGKLSPAQVAWHATITSLGHRVYVCRSVDDVERGLRAEAVSPVGTLAAVTDADVQERAR